MERLMGEHYFGQGSTFYISLDTGFETPVKGAKLVFPDAVAIGKGRGVCVYAGKDRRSLVAEYNPDRVIGWRVVKSGDEPEKMTVAEALRRMENPD